MASCSMTLAAGGDFCVCDRCGRRMKKAAAYDCARHFANCRADAPSPRDPLASPCIHFGGFTGENVTASKDCGCKTAEPETASAWCELFEIVTVVQPAADETIPCCRTCRDYQPT